MVERGLAGVELWVVAAVDGDVTEPNARMLRFDVVADIEGLCNWPLFHVSWHSEEVVESDSSGVCSASASLAVVNRAALTLSQLLQLR